MENYDVIIIGAGVTGTAIARELSRYQCKVCVLEREEDVCCGTSKANSAIIHAGYDAEPGSWKARLNVRGNEMIESLSKELDFPFKRDGSLVLCLDKNAYQDLKKLYDRGIENGIKGLQILNRDEVLVMEPNVSDKVYAALYAPTAGIVCPFHMTIAFAENAYTNGVSFHFNTEVKQIERDAKGWKITTGRGEYNAKCIVNAAGVYADKIHNMVSEKKLHITPRKGEYCLLDKSAGNHVRRTIFTLPGKFGKGVLVTPTVHGNLLIGPTAVDIENKEGVNTTRDGLQQVLEKSAESVKNIPTRQVITSFAGLRAHEDGDDFVIGETENDFIIELYHVKKMNAAKYNSSVDDIYEVAGQAVKSIVWLKTKSRLLSKMEERRKSGHCEFIRGRYDQFRKDLTGTQFVGNVVIVQPSLSKGMGLPDKIQEVLAASSYYIEKSGRVKKMRIMGSK